MEDLRLHARAEEALALAAPLEYNPWEGSIRKLKDRENEHRRMELRAHGEKLQGALTDYRRLSIAITRLEHDKSAKNAEENAKRATPTIKRWVNAHHESTRLEIRHTWHMYSEWVVSGRRKRVGCVPDYPQPNWPSSLIFEDEAERAEIIAWRDLQHQTEALQNQIASVRDAIGRLFDEYPELNGIAIYIPPLELDTTSDELVGTA